MMKEYLNCYEIQFRRPAHVQTVSYYVLAATLESAIPFAAAEGANDYGSEQPATWEVVSVREIARAVIVPSKSPNP